MSLYTLDIPTSLQCCTLCDRHVMITHTFYPGKKTSRARGTDFQEMFILPGLYEMGRAHHVPLFRDTTIQGVQSGGHLVLSPRGRVPICVFSGTKWQMSSVTQCMQWRKSDFDICSRNYRSFLQNSKQNSNNSITMKTKKSMQFLNMLVFIYGFLPPVSILFFLLQSEWGKEWKR